MKITGKVWKFGDNINTDLINPGHALIRPIEEQPQYVFEANRPGWVDEVSPGDVIVGGRNFGVGSSRPASRVLKQLGIAAVVADSFNSLFFRNCVNYALPAIECPGISGIADEGDVILLDLESGEVSNPLLGRTVVGTAWTPDLLEIMHAGGLLNQLREEGLLVESGEGDK